MRLRRLCLEIFAFRRFFSDPIEVFSAFRVRRSAMQAPDAGDCNPVLRRGLGGESVLEQVYVLLRLYLPEDRGDPAGSIDDERASLRAHVFFAVHALLHPDAI